MPCNSTGGGAAAMNASQPMLTITQPANGDASIGQSATAAANQQSSLQKARAEVKNALDNAAFIPVNQDGSAFRFELNAGGVKAAATLRKTKSGAWRANVLGLGIAIPKIFLTKNAAQKEVIERLRDELL